MPKQTALPCRSPAPGLLASWARPRLAAVLVLGAMACGPPAGWVETHPEVAARARRDPGSFATEARARWDDLSGMVGSYQVRARRGINSRRLDTQVYLLRDRFIEINVLAPTGSTEGYLVAGSDEIGFWTADENRLYRGANQPGAFARALGLDLTPPQIVAVLMGYGVDAAAGEVAAEWDAAAQRVRVSRGATSAWLHPVFGHFERVVISTPSGAVEVDYEEWVDEGPPLPRRLRVAVAAEEITLELSLAADWRANPEGLGEDYFEVESVRGAVEVPLRILEAEGGLLRRGLGR